VGIVLMLMLWFRPQGVVPERLRRTASFGVLARVAPSSHVPAESAAFEQR
jgi:hypothetical protein